MDVSTLDLLLSVLAEKNHDINSKSEVSQWHATNTIIAQDDVGVLLCVQCGQTPLHVACAGLRSPAAESAALVSQSIMTLIGVLVCH